jgi:hypothetical protein
MHTAFESTSRGNPFHETWQFEDLDDLARQVAGSSRGVWEMDEDNPEWLAGYALMIWATWPRRRFVKRVLVPFEAVDGPQPKRPLDWA